MVLVTVTSARQMFYYILVHNTAHTFTCFMNVSKIFVSAFKLFLNGENGFCRDLLLQLLVPLWRILHWARSQQKIRLFSTSILLIYDARKLRQLLKLNIKAAPPPIRATHLYKPLSIMQLNGDHICTGFSGQCTQDGPILTQTSKLCNFINDLDTTIKVSSLRLVRHPVQQLFFSRISRRAGCAECTRSSTTLTKTCRSLGGTMFTYWTISLRSEIATCGALSR